MRFRTSHGAYGPVGGFFYFGLVFMVLVGNFEILGWVMFWCGTVCWVEIGQYPLWDCNGSTGDICLLVIVLAY